MFTDTISAGATPVNYAFGGNDAFDPTGSAGTRQCTGFDQWASFYNRYRVWGSAIKLQFVCTNASIPVRVVLVPLNGTAATIATFVSAAAQPYAKWREATAQIAGGNSKLSLSHKMSTRKIMGTTKDQIRADPELQAVTTVSPAHEWTWAIQFSTADDTTAISGFVIWKLLFFVEFFDRIPLAIS